MAGRLPLPYIWVLLSLLWWVACAAEGDRPGIVVSPDMAYSIPRDAYDLALLPPAGTIPVAADRAALARGKHVYQTFCAVCHGAEGRGDGPIIGRFPNPPSLLAERARTLPDGELFHILSRGQGIMAPYAVQVRAADRWRVIHYVRELQGAAP
jgi:mono/diheme cytochrome c family protein